MEQCRSTCDGSEIPELVIRRHGMVRVCLSTSFDDKLAVTTLSILYKMYFA